MLFAVACNTNSNKTVELIDFDSYEEQITLGTMYSLPPAIVEDKEGNEYRVEYEIENSLSQVQINNNQFVIENLSDYVITCKVQVAKDKTLTRIITLKVKDEKAPIVTLGTIIPGFVGVEYVIPAEVTDDSGEQTQIEYTVICNGTSVPTVDGKFTPTQTGEHVITVSATDTQNNTAEESFSIYVREPIGANEVIAFSTPTEITSIKSYGGENPSAEYLTTFEGKTGVAKLNYGNVWPSLQFKPLRQMSDYEPYDEIVFTIYLPKSSTNANTDGNYVKYMKFGNNTADDILPQNVVKDFTDDMYDKWIELVFDAEKFKEYWTDDMQFSLSSTAPRLWGYTTSGGTTTAGSYYIADISVRTALTITAEDITVNNGVATVPTLSVSTKEGTPLTVNEDYTVTSNVTYDYGVPTGYQPNDATFVADEVGVTYKVTYSVLCEGFTYVFVKTLTMPREYGVNEVISFDFASDMNNIKAWGGTATTEYLEEYQGEKGVVKLTYGNQWPFMQFKPLQKMANYADADEIIFRMYFPQVTVTETQKQWVQAWKIQKNNAIIASSINYPGNFGGADLNKWIDVRFDAKTFIDNWTDDMQLINAGSVPNLGGTAAMGGTQGGEYYIADISVRRYIDGEVLSFDHNSDLDKVSGLPTVATKTWLNEFEGETGVMKIEHSAAAYPQFTFKTNLGQDVYEGKSKLVMRMYIPKDEIDNQYPLTNIVLGNSTTASENCSFNFNRADQYNAWINVEFTNIDAFIKYWFTSPSTSIGKVWSNGTNGPNCFYIAAIWVE